MSQPLVSIHPEAKIGSNVKIEPFSTIQKNVVIGDGSWIGPNVTIMEGARIGKNVRIFPGACISGVPQDRKFEGEETTCEIGDNTVIRECVTISRGTKDKLKTVVGNNCLLLAYVHIAHDCILGDHVTLVNSVQLAGHCFIDNFATVGGATAIHQFVRIGQLVMVAGGSLVRKDIPPYTKAAREPVTYCGINSVGLRRRGFSNEKINEIQDIYRYIFQKGYNNSKAIEHVELELPPSSERDEIINFIRSSDRGMMPGYTFRR